MVKQIVIKTHAGMVLRAPVSAAIVGATSIWADWDMRHNLIRNPKFPYVVKPSDVKDIEYV